MTEAEVRRYEPEPLYELDGICRANGLEFRVYADTATDCAWAAVVVVVEHPGALGATGIVLGGRAAGQATADTAVNAAARSAIAALKRKLPT